MWTDARVFNGSDVSRFGFVTAVCGPPAIGPEAQGTTRQEEQ